MNRLSNWQVTLAEVVHQARTKPFEWGKHDCCLFPCDCIEAMTGEDPAVFFRGKYSDQLGAYRALKEFAGGALLETVEKLTGELGFEEVPRLMAQRGDLALCEQDGIDQLGIIDFTGRGVMIAAENGLLIQPLSYVKRTWRI